MNSGSLHDRQKAIVLLVNLLHDPQTVAIAIRESAARFLAVFLKSTDQTSYQKATECIEIMSRHAVGRAMIIDTDIFDAISQFVVHPDEFCRLQVNRTILRISCSKDGVNKIHELGQFKVYMSIVSLEPSNIQVLLLETLRNCIRNTEGDLPLLATECDSLRILTEIARSSLSTAVKSLACECVMMLWYQLNNTQSPSRP